MKGKIDRIIQWKVVILVESEKAKTKKNDSFKGELVFDIDDISFTLREGETVLLEKDETSKGYKVIKKIEANEDKKRIRKKQEKLKKRKRSKFKK